jgi:thiamine kinase-like enzyme
MSAAVEAVLAQIPEWAAASYSQLKGGLTNPCWLIELGDRKAVLKIDEAARHEPFDSRPEEARIQMRAAKQGLANKVIHVTDTVLMTEYIEGVVWSAGCLDVEENLEKLAAAMRKMHSLPLTGRTFDAIGAARGYAQSIKNDAVDSSKVRDCVAKIEAMPLPHNLCCCHNDMVAANIIYVPEVRFLDWEYACDNDPFFDIATIVAHHKLATDRANFLLDAYFDGDGARWRDQLARQTEFYDALHWLWEASRSPAIA